MLSLRGQLYKNLRLLIVLIPDQGRVEECTGVYNGDFTLELSSQQIVEKWIEVKSFLSRG